MALIAARVALIELEVERRRQAARPARAASIAAAVRLRVFHLGAAAGRRHRRHFQSIRLAVVLGRPRRRPRSTCWPASFWPSPPNPRPPAFPVTRAEFQKDREWIENFQKNPEIERLIRLSEAARSCLEDEAAALRQRLDVPARIRSSLQEPSHRLAGRLAGFRPRRQPAVPPQARAPSRKKRRGLPLILLGLTLTAARPLAKVWLTDQVKQ